MTDVKLISITPDAEKLIAYLARVSSDHQDNPDYAKLVKYLLDHKHFSPFEMAHCIIEINTSRAIAAQILRHRSFSFQEFSQRYANVAEFSVPVVGRKQSVKNRQSSTDELGEGAQLAWLRLQQEVFTQAEDAYDTAIRIGVAREQARMLLPLTTPTKLYMAGTIRSWMHYVDLRTQPDTQLEHRIVAEWCRDILTQQLPTIAAALGWPNV